MIETYLLEQFAAFARCGTLLRASEELHITQPTLSRSMKKLEEELGVQIFHRENSKLSLNDTGKIAAEYAQKALQANQDLIDHVLAYDRSLRTISIGSCSPFPVKELMPSLQQYFTEKTILSELVDTDAHLLTGLKNRGYDLVILHSLPEVPGKVDIPISDEDAHATYWVVCRASNLSKYRAIFNAVRGYALWH